VRIAPFSLLLLAAALAQSCDDGLSPHPLGALRVTAATTGGDIDLDGYTLQVDATVRGAVGANATVLVSHVDSGPHVVALGGLADNCAVSGSNPRSVTVAPGDTATAAFAVACVATGVRVTTRTTGLDLDANGYRLRLDGGPVLAIGLAADTAITRLAPGPHTVALSDLAANCTVAGADPVTVTIAMGQTATIAFAVTCVATTGILEVTVVATGRDLDTAYDIRVDDGTPRVLPTPSGVLVFAGLAAGTHRVLLAGVDYNCQVAGTNPRDLMVTTGTTTRDTARTTFDVSCSATTGTVQVTTTTTGAELDPDGYGVTDGYDERPIGVNDTVTFGYSVGVVSLWLVGIAPNCSVDGGPQREITVTGDTTLVAFGVSCVATGALRVSTATSGFDLDPNGYVVRVVRTNPVDSASTAVPDNGAATIAGLSPGDYVVQLLGVAPNCAVSGANPRVVVIPSGGVAAVDFAVSCMAYGGLVVTLSTTGVDLDPDGYEVTATGPVTVNAHVLADGSVPFPQLPPGDYAVSLTDVSMNCTVNPPVATIPVPSGSMASTTLDVACGTAPILAVAMMADGNADIYLVKTNGAVVSRLTTVAAPDEDPAWSPDGSRIAFVSRRDGNAEIYVMNADGSGATRLTNSGGEQPAWSPDGAKIAFASWRGGFLNIYTMDSDGSNTARLTVGTGESEPAWSSDGAKIAFASFGSIYVMNADGSGRTQLTSSHEDHDPVWSPDGASIAFSRFTSCPGYTCDYDLMVMNADGSNVRTLSGWTVDESPAWSPDGRWIAHTATVCDGYGCDPPTVAVVKPDGTGRAHVIDNAYYPSWRP